MTETEWQAANDPIAMLAILHGRLSNRKLLLIACGCCRLYWQKVVIEEFHRTTEILERFADGAASREEFAEASRIANYALDMSTGTAADIPSRYQAPNSNSAAWAVRTLADAEWDRAWSRSQWERYAVSRRTDLAVRVVVDAIENLQDVGGRSRASRRRQAAVVGDLAGNPFRERPSVDAAALAWNGGTVSRLARDAYDDRELPAGHLNPARFRVLADAFEDAGGADADLLEHLRSAGPHYRGCRAVDAILGKR